MNNKIDILANIILNEAPLSTYVKNVGSGVKTAAKFGTRQAGKAVGSLYDPYSGKAKKITQPVGDYLQKIGKTTPAKNELDNISQNKQQPEKQIQNYNPAKVKTTFEVNGTRLPGKYVGNTPNGYPIYRIQGIPWSKSVILEPKKNNKLLVYMYKDKTPNIKKQPVAIRSGSQLYSGVQNKLLIKTK